MSPESWRTAFDRPAPIRECVEGYVFTEAPRRYLLLRRIPSRGGFWQPVSGKVEPRDRDRSAAVLREVQEETGFSQVRRILDLDFVFGFRGSDRGPWRVHAFAVEVSSPGPPRLSPEHDAGEWLAYRDALERLYWPDNRDSLRRLAQRV